jgi:hypothetical protein
MLKNNNSALELGRVVINTAYIIHSAYNMLALLQTFTLTAYPDSFQSRRPTACPWDPFYRAAKSVIYKIDVPNLRLPKLLN